MKNLLKCLAGAILAVMMCQTLSAQNTKKDNAKSVSVLTLKIQNNTFQHVDIVNAYGNTSVTFASAEIIHDEAVLSASLDPDIYRLNFGDDKYMLVALRNGEQVTLTVNAENLQDIVSVSGSPSMAFVKEAYTVVTRRKTILDSLNGALQSDPNQLYWAKQTQNINLFVQTNNDVDNYVLSVFDNVDTLKSLFDRYVAKGAVKGADLETFAQAANKALKNMDKDYQPFENYLENVDKYYDFTDKGTKDGEEYFTMRRAYLNDVDSRHARAQDFLGTRMNSVRRLLAQRDSLVYADKFNKGKNKALWAQAVADSLSPFVDAIAQEHIAWLQLLQSQKDIPNDLVRIAQEQVKNCVAKYQTQYDESEKVIDKKIQDLIRANKSDIAVMMFLDMFPRDKNAELHEEVITALQANFATHPIVKERWTMLHTASVGSMAPELAFPDPEGKIRKLSDLKGKVVIVDFWASWCGPCRRENPNVRRIYNLYHDKGLEIFSVSLDREKANWVKAIADDQLVWPNHVSDLKYWSSEAAALYGVRSIPSTFILNREGRIVAKDLRGQELENAIKALLSE